MESALVAAGKRLANDTNTTVLLVGLQASAGFYFMVQVLIFMVPGLFDGLRHGQTDSPIMFGLYGLTVLAGAAFAVGVALILPALVIIGALRAYRRQYDDVKARMMQGDLALMLVDESFGRMVQEFRENKYKLVLGEVHLGQSFADRLLHFAYYYPQYVRISNGEREFAVTPVSPLNCWMDGFLIACLSCGLGCVYWIIVPLPLRIVYTYPKLLATRRAALDFFLGKWEPIAPLQ
jgi:hypothetical protein